MTARQQKVRLHFLIALTLAVVTFGVSRFVRTLKREEVRQEYVRTEREIRRYTDELLQAEQEELESMARAGPRRSRSDAAALLMQARYQTEQAKTERTPAAARQRAQALTEIKASFARLREGKAPAFPKGQPFLRAYYAAVDGSFQPYGICLPATYRNDQAYPLIITLHGLAGFDRFQCLNAPHYEGAISVKPQGRGATDFMYLGEDDVLAVLEDVRRLYSVDASRVYLIGHSMGATGAWHLAVHYPHLFAGIVPISGNADHRVWEESWGWNAGPATTHQQLREFLHRSLSPVSYAENLLHCQVVALHGTGDRVVPVGHSRSMVSRLRELGYAFEYLEFPGAAHGGFPGWTEEYALAKVFGESAPARPAHIVYRTAQLRHNRAWWLHLDGLDSPVQFAEATADAAGTNVDVITRNVTALTVLLEEAPVEVRQLTVDGAAFSVPPPAKGAVFSMERRDGTWQAGRPVGPTKRRGLSGPFSDVLRDPFLVVYGTAGADELHKAISRGEAERFAAEWRRRYGEGPRLKSDAEVTPNDLARLNLLLFGGPAVNALTARLIAGMPFSVSDRAVVLGEEPLQGDDVGLLACYPNPRRPERMVALAAGTTPAALYQAADRAGLWFNWGVYDKYKWFDYAVFDAHTVGPESFLAAGFFDNRWQLAPRGGGPAGGGAEWRKDVRASEGLAPQGFPRLASAAEGEDAEVALSDVRPSEIDQYRGPVAFNRGYGGYPIRLAGQAFPKGLGVKVPSSLTFELGGRFRSFTSTVGLTPGLKQEVSAVRVEAEEVSFEVWGDGRMLASSPPLNRRDNGSTWHRLEANVTGVHSLTLKAVPANKLTWLYGACAWGDPTVSR